jgi:hypothetical protein
MKQVTGWLKAIGAYRIVAIVLTTFVFLTLPALSDRTILSARADFPIIQTKPETVDKGTIKRIQQKAEDLGDSSSRPIGDTGLKNIRNLGENIPETLDLNRRQKGAIYDRDQDNKVKAMDRAQRQAERQSKD